MSSSPNEFSHTGLDKNISTLDDLDKSNRDLAAKVAVAEEHRAHEKSVGFLLNFELSQIRQQIEEVERDVMELEREHKRLVRTNQGLSSNEKLVRNYFSYINSLQVDRKEEYIQNLRADLSAIDFALEQKREGQSLNDGFTQNVAKNVAKVSFFSNGEPTRIPN